MTAEEAAAGSPQRQRLGPGLTVEQGAGQPLRQEHRAWTQGTTVTRVAEAVAATSQAPEAVGVHFGVEAEDREPAEPRQTTASAGVRFTAEAAVGIGAAGLRCLAEPAGGE